MPRNLLMASYQPQMECTKGCASIRVQRPRIPRPITIPAAHKKIPAPGSGTAPPYPIAPSLKRPFPAALPVAFAPKCDHHTLSRSECTSSPAAEAPEMTER